MATIQQIIEKLTPKMDEKDIALRLGYDLMHLAERGATYEAIADALRNASLKMRLHEDAVRKKISKAHLTSTVERVLEKNRIDETRNSWKARSVVASLKDVVDEDALRQLLEEIIPHLMSVDDEDYDEDEDEAPSIHAGIWPTGNTVAVRASRTAATEPEKADA